MLLDLYPNKLYSLSQYKQVINKMKKDFPHLSNYAQQHSLYVFGDHPTFFFLRKLLAQNTLPIPVISKLGPFHIWLNVVTDTGIYFNHIYQSLYFKLFGSKIGPKPKCHIITYLNHLLFIAWTAIRDQVLAIISFKKDIELQSLIFFYEEVLPIAVMAYGSVFRSSNMNEWHRLLERIQLLFITWKRKRYVQSFQRGILIGIYTK